MRLPTPCELSDSLFVSVEYVDAGKEVLKRSVDELEASLLVSSTVLSVLSLLLLVLRGSFDEGKEGIDDTGRFDMGQLLVERLKSLICRCKARVAASTDIGLQIPFPTMLGIRRSAFISFLPFFKTRMLPS